MAIWERLPKQEQRRLWRHCYFKAWRRDWQVWVAMLAMGLCGGAGGALGMALGVGIFGAVIGGAIGGALGGLNLNISLCAIVRPYLEERLIALERGEPVDPNAT